MHYQFFWSHWSFHYAKDIAYHDDYGNVYEHFLIIGPLQLNWYSSE
jgi:hypothetical protein